MTHINFSVAALDCPDPLELANFYARLTGLEVEPLGASPRRHHMDRAAE
jgi:hypothetical protein